MKIPEIVYYADALPESDGLLLLSGATLGGAEDYDFTELTSHDGFGILLPVFMPGTVEDVGEAGGAAHFLYARAADLDQDEKNGFCTLRECIGNTLREADEAGVREMSFLPVPAAEKNSRLFSVMTVFFRLLMEEREKHPCLEGIRFLCRTREEAEWICRVYNFYYPADKSERMLA